MLPCDSEPRRPPASPAEHDLRSAVVPGWRVSRGRAAAHGGDDGAAPGRGRPSPARDPANSSSVDAVVS